MDLVLCLCCIYCVCSVVWEKVNFNCDLKFSGPRNWYLVVRNRINKAMETLFFTININWEDLKKAETFANLFPNSAISECSSNFKVFNEDGYFHASIREKKVKRFNWINFETWCFEPKRINILWLIAYFVMCRGFKIEKWYMYCGLWNNVNRPLPY